jgi:sodium transport system ATP-binding protein
MSEVERLCDQVAIMHRGNIIAAGSLEKLAEQFEIDDFEELFYQLVASNERKMGQVALG